MRKIFFKKLKANDGYFREIFKHGCYQVDIPILKNRRLRTYSMTIQERQNKKKPRISFYVGHIINGEYFRHILSDNSMNRLDEDILEEFQYEIDKFIYGDNKDL